jgi:crotonobetainyl-CoA:carnitine CoA-transferase CaiB-like acyl-CoA transferase
MIVEIHHPQHGVVKQFGQPIKLSETPGSVRTAAPAAGEHTDQVLRELGLGAGEIAAMREKKVVA